MTTQPPSATPSPELAAATSATTAAMTEGTTPAAPEVEAAGAHAAPAATEVEAPTGHITPGPNGTALVIGEALVDIVINEGQDPQEIPGGSPANVALGLSRLGRDAALACWIGRDLRGLAVRNHLEEAGVRLVEGSDGAEATSTAKASIGSDGAATYVFDVDWNPPFPELGQAEAPLVVHTGSIAAILQPGAATVQRTLATYRATSTICYDPNARPQLMGERDQARQTAEDIIELSDLVKCSNEDIEWLYGVDGSSDEALAKVLDTWIELGAAITVVTRGGDGALVKTASGLTMEIKADPTTVVDTVGAGDSFMGGLEDGLWSEGLVGAEQRPALYAIDEETLERVVRHAAAIAAITVSRAGANPPTRAELAERA